jgi:hypothetical protein
MLRLLDAALCPSHLLRNILQVRDALGLREYIPFVLCWVCCPIHQRSIKTKRPRRRPIDLDEGFGRTTGPASSFAGSAVAAAWTACRKDEGTEESLRDDLEAAKSSLLTFVVSVSAGDDPWNS